MICKKNLLVCVSGSIAIYKSLELIRLYIKNGANVKVLMTKGAKKFINPLTFEAISGNKVLHEKTESWTNNYNHIKITKDIDCIIIAPATANTINKFAFGISDNLLTQTLIASKKPILIAPAMNTNMLNHIKKSKKILKKQGVNFVKTSHKQLACLDTGKGALADIEDIFLQTCKIINQDKFWKNKKVLITGGGTEEKIDDVRFVGNFSSGKMALSLAKAFYIKGANVTFITSKHEDIYPFKSLNFTDTASLKTHLKAQIPSHEYLLMASAVSDFKPKETKKGKIKKKDLGSLWNLELIKNEDLLANLDKKNIKTIGFKAEFDEKNALENAKKMLKEKNLDGVCLNILGNEVNFGSNKTQISFINKNGIANLPFNDKFATALEIVDLVK